MLHKNIFIIFSFVFFPLFSQAIPYFFKENISWESPQTLNLGKGDSIHRLNFDGALFSELDVIPYYNKVYPIHSSEVKITASIFNIHLAVASKEETEILKKAGFKKSDFDVTVEMGISRKQPLAYLKIIPVRWNENLKKYEKLVHFEVKLDVKDVWHSTASMVQIAEHSVLKKGDWFKIRVDTTGVFKLTYTDLSDMGFDLNGNPANIGLFGNGGGTLPEKNSAPRLDDLVENPIIIVGGADGSFDKGDYILFYGQGPVVWKYSPFNGQFRHQINYYDNYSYYFLTRLDHRGKRIKEEVPASGTPDEEVTTFIDYVYHNEDNENIGATGRTWYGEIYDFNLEYDFTYNFPNIIQQNDGYVYARFASHSFSTNSFSLSINGVLQKTLPLSNTLDNGYEFGRSGDTDFTFTPKSDAITFGTKFNRVSAVSVGYLDYFDINVKRRLIFTGSQMLFRNPFSSPVVARYKLKAPSDVNVWDVSNPIDPMLIKPQQSGDYQMFKVNAEGVKQFIAFNGTQYYKPEFVGKVENQDLHAVSDIDFLIISYPDFLAQANRLADFHRTKDHMKVYVTTPEKIYNEFSSGSQDITAIRDFIKMIYDKSDAGSELKYVLLFGDASYDYKNRLSDNTNFVPCWESISSLNIITSIATDDYFGYLDNNEGAGEKDFVDVGIGRFPVSTVAEAQNAVDKCIRYATTNTQVMGPWRNRLTFLADDEDSNLHLRHAEILSGFIDKNYPVYNINKIYVDAYKQISTPSGQRAPAVNRAIDNSIDKGTLILNYSGHGGEIGLGHEQFLRIADIQSWTNYNKLTVFITATCEFTRYDDPSRTSAGELVFLSTIGGGIALFSTSRATYASANLALNRAIYSNNIFKKFDGEYPCFGDVIRRSKILGGSNDKKFILIGDPALKLAYPKLNAKTTVINNYEVNQNKPDTLSALSKVKIEGIITDIAGNKQTNYNGIIYPVVFDKKTAVLTLGTDAKSIPTTFYMWKSILFKGKAPVVNGEFSFDFMVPKDIAYNYGVGRISYYFNNDTIDGNGYNENVIIGGFNENARQDVNGPIINLYMNDVMFKPGDITNEDPSLFAKVSDESGINTTGNGIGHDIIAKIDDNINWTFNLNDYYEATEGNYNKGSITFPFRDLPDGEHQLSLKVWDIYNNSSTAVLPFVVSSSEKLVISNLMNIPNPVTDHTDFVFEHNQPGVDLDVVIEVYQLNGVRVKTLHTHINSPGFQSGRLRWNCTTDNNRKIGRGIYVYQLKVTTPDGKIAFKRSKLVFLR